MLVQQSLTWPDVVAALGCLGLAAFALWLVVKIVLFKKR